MTTPRFKPGDRVTFVNDNGVRWLGKTIKEVAPVADWRSDEPHYHYEPTDTPWFCVPERNLELVDMALAHSTYAEYQACRKELGYDENGGLIFEVWVKTEPEAMRDHVRQMKEAVQQQRDYIASQPEGWGAW
jgi:hypothetical protein